MFDWYRKWIGQAREIKMLSGMAQNALADRNRVVHELNLLRAEIGFQVQTAKELGFPLRPHMSDASKISALLGDLKPLVEKGRRYEESQQRYNEKRKAARAAAPEKA